MRKEVGVLGMFLLLFVFRGVAQLPDGSSISLAAIKEITLYTTSGKQNHLQPSKEPLRLFVMLSPECPLCKNYSLVLNKLNSKYSNSMQVYGIVPGNAYSGAELQQFATDFKISFPLLIDKEKKLSGYLKATVTPEVFLMNKAGRLVYRGAVDDWVEELGRKKTAPQQHYLENAITQYLAGVPVQLSSTIAKGCFINDY